MNFRNAIQMHVVESHRLLRQNKDKQARRHLERATILRKAMQIKREVRAEKAS